MTVFISSTFYIEADCHVGWILRISKKNIQLLICLEGNNPITSITFERYADLVARITSFSELEVTNASSRVSSRTIFIIEVDVLVGAYGVSDSSFILVTIPVEGRNSLNDGLLRDLPQIIDSMIVWKIV